MAKLLLMDEVVGPVGPPCGVEWVGRECLGEMEYRLVGAFNVPGWQFTRDEFLAIFWGDMKVPGVVFIQATYYGRHENSYKARVRTEGKGRLLIQAMDEFIKKNTSI